MEKKQRLLALISKAYEIEQTFIAGLSGEERTEMGTFERWCAKDVIAHNASWKSRMADNLMNAAQGRLTQRTEDYNHDNAEFYKEHCQKTWEEVLIFANRAYRAFGEQVAALSEVSLEDSELLPWQEGRRLWRLVIDNGYLHPVTHIGEYHRDRGRLDAAAELLAESVRQGLDFDDSPEWQGEVQYNLACQYALLGQTENAIQALKKSFSFYPDLIEFSKTDTDLVSIRLTPAYQSLLTG